MSKKVKFIFQCRKKYEYTAVKQKKKKKNYNTLTSLHLVDLHIKFWPDFFHLIQDLHKKAVTTAASINSDVYHTDYFSWVFFTLHLSQKLKNEIFKNRASVGKESSSVAY